MFNKMKKSLQSTKAKVMTVAFPAIMVAGQALAETGGTANSSVVEGFTTIKADIIATLGSVAPLGLGIMGIFLAWRYGHRIFKTVAK